MTFSKLCARVVEYGPRVITPHTRTPTHCILATAVGVSTLAAFGVEAVPLAVRALLTNGICTRLLEQVPDGGAPDWDAIAAAGGRLLDTGGPGEGTIDAAANWRGHLVIHVPAHGCVIDLNLGAMDRPHKGIRVPAAASMQFRPPTCAYELPDGGRLEYAVSDDASWTDAPDWRVERRVALVAALVRAIRKGGRA